MQYRYFILFFIIYSCGCQGTWPGGRGRTRRRGLVVVAGAWAERVAAGHYNTCTGTSWMIEIVSSKMYRRQKAVANLRSLCCLTCFCHLPDTRYLPRKSTSYVVEHVYAELKSKWRGVGGYQNSFIMRDMLVILYQYGTFSLVMSSCYICGG